MRIAPSTCLSLAGFPSEVVENIVARLPTGDVARVAQTCRRLWRFAHDPAFVARYVKGQVDAGVLALPPPSGAARLRWLQQPSGSMGRCCDALAAVAPWHGALPYDDKGLAAVKSAERLEGAQGELPVRGWGVYHPGYHYAPRSLRSKPRGAVGWGTTTSIILDNEFGYTTTLAKLRFPDLKPGDSEHRFERFYEVDRSLVALCTAGNETWVYRIGPSSQGVNLESTSGWAFNMVTQTLTLPPLCRIKLTPWGMAPLAWDQKIRAVLVWDERAPRLMRMKGNAS